ncbi:tetratricopeptide repeat protein [Persicitalea sp.]|uniref:tetratricopeptide repeat protein n=1 Tax=Persicitalea sp. TaxID=3100273 RepID=UPI003593ED6D
MLLRTVGKPAEAVSYSARAVELDPLHPVILSGHIRNCSYAGRYDLAIKGIENGKQLFENSFIFYICRGYYHLDREQYAEALTNLKKTEELNPGLKHFHSLVAFCQARLGKENSARRHLATLGTSPDDDLSRAIIYAGTKQAESSIASLQRAANQGFVYTDMLLHPAFRLHHRDPRFLEILKDFGLPAPMAKVN